MVQLAVEPVQRPESFFCLDQDPQTTRPRSTGFGVLMMEHTFCTKKKKKKSAQEVSCSSPVHRESVSQNDTNPRTNITHIKCSKYLYTVYYMAEIIHKPQEIKTVEGKHSHEARVTALVIQSSTWKLGCEIVYQQQIQLFLFILLSLFLVFILKCGLVSWLLVDIFSSLPDEMDSKFK